MENKKEKSTPGQEKELRDHLKELPEVRPIYFKRSDSEKLWGVPSRVLADLALKKKGCRFFRKGKYCYYEVNEFERWLTENPVKTT